MMPIVGTVSMPGVVASAPNAICRYVGRCPLAPPHAEHNRLGLSHRK